MNHHWEDFLGHSPFRGMSPKWVPDSAVVIMDTQGLGTLEGGLCQAVGGLEGPQPSLWASPMLKIELIVDRSTLLDFAQRGGVGLTDPPRGGCRPSSKGWSPWGSQRHSRCSIGTPLTLPVSTLANICSSSNGQVGLRGPLC